MIDIFNQRRLKHIGNYAIVFIVMAFLWLIIGCAATEKITTKPAPLETPEDAEMKKELRTSIGRKAVVDQLKKFNLTILVEPHTPCPGPGGKNLIYLGRDHVLKLILEFDDSVYTSVKPEDLFARVGNIKHTIPFTGKLLVREFSTPKTRLDFLDDNLDTGPAGISIYYKDAGDTTLLGRKGRVVVDTVPPPRPENIRVVNRGEGNFSLTWEFPGEIEPGEIREVFVRKFNNGHWDTIYQGPMSLPVVVNAEPEGQYRVEAVDCALNTASTDFSPVVHGPGQFGIRITREGRGSEILSDLFRTEASQRGYTVHDGNTDPGFEPENQLTIQVTIGNARPLPQMGGMNCWHIRARMHFTRSSTGQSVRLTERDVKDIDARIYGPTLDQALHCQSGNCFTERIGRPLVSEFIRQFDEVF